MSIINAGEFLARRAMLSPAREALVIGERRYAYAELNRRANRAVRAMERLGVRPGDRVAIVAGNGVEHYDLFFGLGKCGAITVPLNYRQTAAEISAAIRDCGPRVVIHGREYAGLVEEAAASSPPFQAVSAGHGRGCYEELIENESADEPRMEAADDDEMAIIYSCWAAGRPRGVMLSHDNFFWAAVTATATVSNLGPRFLLALPFFHIGALGWLPFFAHRGLHCTLMPGFDPVEFLDLMERERVTSFGAVPAMLKLLRETPGFDERDFSAVRSILAYGQATPVELIREYAKRDIRVRQLYGLTESAGPVLIIDAEHAVTKAGSCGLPFFHTRVRLVDESGEDAAPGERGEIAISAGHVMKGYWNEPEATCDVVRGGWLYTGDLARQDEDGFFYIVDRKKDVIISGGENIYPAEIEAVLFDHPGVADAAVVGFPDELWGERPRAVVVKKKSAAGLTGEELIEFCRTRLAGYKAPDRVDFADALPRTLTGKMQKWKLREELE